MEYERRVLEALEGIEQSLDGIATTLHKLRLELNMLDLNKERTYTTTSGRVLTDADIDALADEAEKGYDVGRVKERTSRTGREGGGLAD